MKKISIIITILFLIITGGWLILKAIQETKLLQEEKPSIEKYLKYNYENIETVTLTEVKVNPTGVPHILGYVNNNTAMTFDAGIYNDHFEGDLSSIGEIPLKQTNKTVKYGFKNVADIEKEEAEQQTKIDD